MTSQLIGNIIECMGVGNIYIGTVREIDNEFINKYKENYQLKPYWTDNRYISTNEKSLKDNLE